MESITCREISKTFKPNKCSVAKHFLLNVPLYRGCSTSIGKNDQNWVITNVERVLIIHIVDASDRMTIGRLK